MNPNVLRYRDLIVDTARRYYLSPSLVAGLIEVESQGNPDAVSKAGAIGLGQVMPGEVLAGRPSAQELRNPIVNVEWTCRLLADGRQRWGTQAGMLAAYYGAVDGEGHPSSATDGSGVDGWGYVRAVEAAALTYLTLDQAASAEYREWAPQTGGWLEAAANLRGIATDALETGRKLQAELRRLGQESAQTAEAWGGR